MNTHLERSWKVAFGWQTSLAVALILSCALFLTFPRAANAQVGSLACGTALFGSAAGALSSSVPVHDSQVQSNTSAMKNVQCTWNGIAWQLAKTALHSLTGSVVNWINSGFQGSPAFLTNPEGYFLNLADQATGEFISDTGVLTALCSPFNIDVRLALALGQANINPHYTCTLDSIINNVQHSTINGASINGFMNGDFSQGGWPAFIAIGEPNNNEAGIYLQAQSDLAERISGQKSQKQQELLQGNGFLSYQSCTDITASIASGGSITPQYINQTLGLSNAQYAQLQKNVVGTYNTSNGSSIVQTANATGEHYQQCQTQTPGSVINSSLEKVLGSSVDELGLTNDINEIVNALFSQLLIKTLSGGLSGASQSTSGSSNLGSITNQLIQDQQGQANAAALQGQAAGQVQEDSSSVQQAVSYRSQIVTAVTTEQAKYQTVQACIANELSAAPSPNGGSAPNQNNNLNHLPSNYLQSELDSINTAITGINGQVSDAQTNLATASSTLLLYQQAAGGIAGASSLSQANDLSNQYATQLSTIPYNGAADSGLAYSDLNSTLAGITVLDTNLKDYQSVCNGVRPQTTPGH